MNKKILIFVSVAIAFLAYACRDLNNGNVEDCYIKEINLEAHLDSINSEFSSDTLSFSLQSFFAFDSLFVFPPYTSIPKLENELDCKFLNFSYVDDDTWCLILFKKSDKYYFSVVNRRYDLINIVGNYSSQIPLIVGTKKGNRILFKLSY